MPDRNLSLKLVLPGIRMLTLLLIASWTLPGCVSHKKGIMLFSLTSYRDQHRPVGFVDTRAAEAQQDLRNSSSMATAIERAAAVSFAILGIAFSHTKNVFMGGGTTIVFEENRLIGPQPPPVPDNDAD